MSDVNSMKGKRAIVTDGGLSFHWPHCAVGVDVDYRPATGLVEQRQRHLHQAKGTNEVPLKSLPPLLEVGAFDRADLARCKGTVDEAIELALARGTQVGDPVAIILRRQIAVSSHGNRGSQPAPSRRDRGPEYYSFANVVI